MTQRYTHVARAIAEMPWAIRPSTLLVILDLVQYRMEGSRLSDEEVAERIGAERQPNRASSAGQGIALLPVYGVLAPKSAMFAQTSGPQGTGVDSLRAILRTALADPDVGSILMDIDSPGGQVDQIPELAAELRAARAIKPIVAIANTDAASAAYWLGAQATELMVTPSGQVGSVGVFSAHEDISQLEAIEGRKTSLISAGKYKVESNPFEPLNDDARQEIQSKVDEYYSLFITDLARGRNTDQATVRKDYGEGRMLTAKKALQRGMVDKIGTFDDAVRRASALGARVRPAAQAAQDWADGVRAALADTSDNANGSGTEPFSQHGERALATLAGFVQRAQDRKAFRAADDRDLSAGDQQRIFSIRSAAQSLIPALDALLANPALADEAMAEYARFAETDSRLPVTIR